MEFYEQKEENRLHTAVSWIVDLVVVIALATYLVYSFGSRIEVRGSSMRPLLESGDVVLINRLSYDLGKPGRFDVAVFARDDLSLNVRRIIGLPGETIQIQNNRIYIDGEPLEAEEESLLEATFAGLAEYPLELRENEYFLLGDNRESSEDSRFEGIGKVKREKLLGKVWFKLGLNSEASRIR